MKNYIILIVFIIATAVQNTLYAQGKKIEVLNANTLQIETRGTTKVKKLLGDVKLKQDETVLSCDSAYLFDETNYVEAYQHVNINHKDSVNFFGDILKYDGNKKVARLEKNVSMVDVNTTLTTNELEFDLINNKASYYNGGVVISSNNKLTSKQGYYFTTSKQLFFKNDVVLNNPEFNLVSDTLMYQTQTKLATFYSNTIINSNLDTIYCKLGTYNTQNLSGILYKRAKIRSSENTLIADTIIYNRKTKYMRALGNVFLNDTINRTAVVGNRAEVFGIAGYSYVTDSPIVISLMDNDTMLVMADTIVTIQKRKGNKGSSLSAFKNVKIYKSDIQVVCDSLVYIKNDSVMTLYNRPVLWSQQNQVTGDTILFYINNKKLDSMDVLNNSFVISKETNRHFNQVKGKNMTALFNNGKINVIRVYGNGQSIYYAQEDSSYIGVNVIDCSEMRFDFELGKIKTAKFITQPDATFYPIGELTPEELRLNGFVWMIKQKPNRQIFKLRKLYQKDFEL